MSIIILKHSCVSVEFQFCVSMRRISDDAPKLPILSDARRSPPSVTSESRDEESGSVTPDISPRLARIVSEDLAHCSLYVAQVKRDQAVLSSSGEEKVWHVTGFLNISSFTVNLILTFLNYASLRTWYSFFL